MGEGGTTPTRGRQVTSPSCWSYPSAEVALSSTAAVVVFAAQQAALIQAAVFRVFDVPFMTKVQLAQQGLDHDLLQSNCAASPGNLIMALVMSPGIVAVVDRLNQ